MSTALTKTLLDKVVESGATSDQAEAALTCALAMLPMLKLRPSASDIVGIGI